MNAAIGMFILLMILYKTIGETKTLTDVSVNKPSYQISDIYYHGAFLLANFANDGNSDMNLDHFSCSHTLNSNPSWWLVDLQGLHGVKQIIFTYNDRNDGFMYNFSIDVFRTDPRLKANFPNEPGELCYRVEGTLGPATYTWNCSTPVIGRYVRVIRYAIAPIIICEIKVMGHYFDPNDGLFIINENRLLQLPPIFVTTVRSYMECAAECLQPRQDQICMGFNWISSTKQCQLMDFSTRNTSLSSLLVYNTDAIFTAMEQTWNV